MNHERSHREVRTSSHSKQNRIVRPQSKIKYTRPIASPPTFDRFWDNHQGILFQRFLWLWLQHSSWSNFGRGLFWGLIVGLTAVFSASGGVALTKIDIVEQAIARTISNNSRLIQPNNVTSLTHPLNILAIEVEPISNEMIEFSQAFIGESKTILLLKFQPELGTTEVINIPPDSRVKIPGLGWGTLADADRYGGTTLVSQLVSQLLDNAIVDRYVKGTSETFQQLIDSGKITLDSCNTRTENCSNRFKQVSRQKIATETIRQRLNVPGYFNNFQQSSIDIQPDLDTNLSIPEIMSVANFVKDLESENIAVNLISEYIPGKSLYINNQFSQSSLLKERSESDSSKTNQQSNDSLVSCSILSPYKGKHSNECQEKTVASYPKNRSVKNISIAVQNTTQIPELGMRLVSYLRSQNFQDVYLVEHIPLRLDKTKIIIDRKQLTTAKHLKKILGFGGLESKFRATAQPLTIQIGKDARHLFL